MTGKTRYPIALVGAGPGDMDLITVKGKARLQKADIIVYDYLASEQLLSLAPASAKRIFVGKKGFSDHVTQDEINELLIGLATNHPKAHIVRLKGGDPFVFGRGGEEALALHDAGVPFEVVPGVTAGVAAPAYAGIPVTHRKVSSSVAFVTGNEASDKTESSIRWDALANGVDTICFYMGVKNLPYICKRLLDAGRAPSTPIALVRWGTLPLQTVLISTLAEVVADVERVGFSAPAIIVVGDVVSLRTRVSWFEQASLFGRKVLVTRSHTQASALTSKLHNLGALVYEFPTIAIEPIKDTRAVDKAIEQLETYAWVVFTSTNGVECFFNRLRTLGLDARKFGNARVASIGPATATALAAHGIVADVVPAEYRGEAVAAKLIQAGISGESVLIARAEQARNDLPALLQEAGARVNIVALYRTTTGDAKEAIRIKNLLEDGEIDAITFTSSSTVSNFCKLMGTDREVARLLSDVDLFSIGPVTSQTMRGHGLEPRAEAKEYTISGLVDAMVATWRVSSHDSFCVSD